MKQYVEVDDLQSWKDGANKYFNQYGTKPEWRVYSWSLSKDHVTGFALVNRCYRFISRGNVLSQFYITPEKRGEGHGNDLAKFVFDQQPGTWEVSVVAANVSGLHFWEKVVSRYSKGNYEVRKKESYDGVGFTFNNAVVTAGRRP